MGLLKFIMLTQFWPQVALLCLLVYAQLHSPRNRIMTEQMDKPERKSRKFLTGKGKLVFFNGIGAGLSGVLQ